MEYDFNEYNYDMVSVHVHELNTNLCKEVTGGLFYLLLYSYYMYEMIDRSVLQQGGGPRKVYLWGKSACRRPHIFNIFSSMAKYTTIL